MSEFQPVVIDNGTGVIKAGIAGEERPKVVFRSMVGRVKHKRVMAGGALESEFVMGKRAEEHRGALRLANPMEHGVVTNWEDMERLWQFVYAEENLNLPTEGQPALLTEAALNPATHREKAAQVFFETFHCPALYFSPQATLSLYATGRTTGVVLDVGDGVAHAAPVYEGLAITHAITRVDVGGRDVTNHLEVMSMKPHLYYGQYEQPARKGKECRQREPK